jgi:hypothetical protein
MTKQELKSREYIYDIISQLQDSIYQIEASQKYIDWTFSSLERELVNEIYYDDQRTTKSKALSEVKKLLSVFELLAREAKPKITEGKKYLEWLETKEAQQITFEIWKNKQK